MKEIRVRCIVGDGNSSGELVYSEKPIAFLQGVDPERGVVTEKSHPIYNKLLAGKILVFPNSVGSSVGAYVIYRMKRAGKAPKAIINQSADIITASGCAIAGIALYDLPFDKIEEFSGGKKAAFNSKNSEVRIIS